MVTAAAATPGGTLTSCMEHWCIDGSPTLHSANATVPLEVRSSLWCRQLEQPAPIWEPAENVGVARRGTAALGHGSANTHERACVTLAGGQQFDLAIPDQRCIQDEAGYGEIEDQFVHIRVHKCPNANGF